MENIKFETSEEMYRRFLTEGAMTSKSMAEMKDEMDTMDALEEMEEDLYAPCEYDIIEEVRD